MAAGQDTLSKRSARSQSGRGRRPHDSEATKEALLDAATVEFARHGYRDAGLREICARAGTNTGLVHYHFGGKKQLYREALVRAHRRMFDEAGVPTECEDEDAERGLRTWIGFALGINLLRRPHHAAGKMLAFEARDPSEALGDMVRQIYVPIRGMLEQIVGRLMREANGGRPVDDDLRGAATDRVLSLIVMYEQHVPILRLAGRPVPRTQADVDALADQAAEFALGGIERLARSNTKRRK